MVDITKCDGVRKSLNYPCPLRDNCYRFTAPAGQFQSYFSAAPFTMTPAGDFKLSRAKNQWLAECSEFIEAQSHSARGEQS